MRIRVAPVERPGLLAASLLQCLGFTVVATLIVVGAEPLGIGNLKYIAVVVALLGAVGLVGAGLDAFGYTRFGPVPLLMEKLPALGGPLRARFRLPFNLGRASAVQALLECRSFDWVRNKSEEGGYWDQHVVWSATGSFPVRLRAADIVFRLPTTQPITTFPQHGEPMDTAHTYHGWVLEVHVDAEGLDLKRTYWIDVLPEVR